MYFEDPPMPFFPFPRWTDSKEDANGALHSENNGRFVSKGKGESRDNRDNYWQKGKIRNVRDALNAAGLSVPSPEERTRLLTSAIEVSSLSKDEENAITAYTGPIYKEINYRLRHNLPLTGEAKRVADLLDSAFNKCVLKEPITVYRGVSRFEDSIKNGKYFDAGYISTSVNPFRAERFGKHKNNILVLNLKPGTHIIPAMIYSHLPQQEEGLLIRGSKGNQVGEAEKGDYSFRIVDISLPEDKTLTKDSLFADEKKRLEYEEPYVVWHGEKLSFDFLCRVGNGEDPITLEDFKNSYMWPDLDDTERKRVVKYWDHPERYASLA